MTETRDHGGGLDAAMAEFGGARTSWLDLSTGINPVPYPVGEISAQAWTALPDQTATDRLMRAARGFWSVPEGAEIVLAPGASALIARLPQVLGNGTVCVNNPTYNEYEAAFEASDDWGVTAFPHEADAMVYVHPNNPSGRFYDDALIGAQEMTMVDESFCDLYPEASHVAHADGAGVIVLKSFGKFWGLAGLRLGAAICAPKLAARMREALGPWPVSGPALEIGARALEDEVWARETRTRLKADAQRLDRLMQEAGAEVTGGTDLFRLYAVDDASQWQRRLAGHHIWSRIFPYSKTWLRLGLPAPDQWAQVERALGGTAGGAMTQSSDSPAAPT